MILIAPGKRRAGLGLVGTVDKFSNEEFFSAILSSRILVPYLERDPDLAELVKSPDHPDIHYFIEPAPADQLLPVLKKRLGFLVSKNIDHNLEATRQLVSFLEEHPESQIYNVSFNCPTRHYGVRCAEVDQQLHVICVITGGHLSEDLLKESTS